MSILRRLLPLIVLWIISGCTTPVPTSQKLDLIRASRLPSLAKEIKAGGFEIGAPMVINIYKEEKELEVWMPRAKKYGVWQAPELYKTYPICAYSGTLGPKLREGDRQAPEGFYSITPERLNPWSKYHLSMDMGYPNDYDRALGRTGSHLMIHGDCRSEGCYAIGDAAIEDVYLMAEQSFKNGADRIYVNAYPFRMTSAKLFSNINSPWINFWLGLSQGKYSFPTQ